MDPEASKALFDEEVAKMRSMARFSDKAWPITSANYPDLVVELPHPDRRRLFRFRCDNWDEQAPSVKVVDANGQESPDLPEGQYFLQLSVGWGLCIRGTREYHEHHKQDNPWSNYRGNLSLAQIVSSVAAQYRKATKA